MSASTRSLRQRLLFSGLTHLSLLDVGTGRVQPLLPMPRLYDQ